MPTESKFISAGVFLKSLLPMLYKTVNSVLFAKNSITSFWDLTTAEVKLSIMLTMLSSEARCWVLTCKRISTLRIKINSSTWIGTVNCSFKMIPGQRTFRHSSIHSPGWWNMFFVEAATHMYVCNKVIETNFVIILSQIEFQLAYGQGTRQMLMTPWPLIEYQ